MKKRLTSVLLTICMVASLFSAMGVTASADGVETVEYTLKSGDTVYKICQKLGIDFYANYDWITSTNNIKNYSSLGVGKKILLPLSDTKGVVGGAVSGGTTTAPSGTASLQLLTGDSIASYLIPYVVSSGDTLYDICLGKGINYKDNVDSIMKVNGLKNANRLAVGRTLLLPSATAPASGACVAVVAHKIVSGDATYNICGSYNIDYEDNLELLKALNGKSNMASIKTGFTLYVPVPTTVVAGGGNAGAGGNVGGTTGGNVGSNNGGNTNNNNNSGNTNNSGSTTPAVSYKINQNTTNVNQGSYYVLVNNTNASTAVAGDTVTVNATAKTGFKLDYVSVTDKNGNAVSLNGTTFTMPASDVTVKVYFVSSTDYKITSAYAQNGSYIVTVNGVETNRAAEGQTIKVVPTAAYGYELDKITYQSSTGTVVNDVTNKTFTMPGRDITINVSFKAAVDHDIEYAGVANGNFNTTINGTKVTKAKAGEVVTVNTTPADGFELKKITVTGTNNGVEVPVTNGTFVMPEYKVTVKVKFVGIEFNVISAAATNGSFTVSADKAEAGAWMQVVPAPDAGYVVDKIYFTDSKGDKVQITSSDYSFTMPARDTTISVSFKMRPYYLAADSASPAAVFTVNGKAATSAYMGETVTIDGKPADGVKVKSIEVYRTSGGKSVPMASANSFVMPAGNVTVKVTYELIEYTLGANYPSVSFKLTDANGKAITTARMGDTIYIASKPDAGFHTSNLTAVDSKGNKVEVNLSAQTFTMPASNVFVTASYARNS